MIRVKNADVEIRCCSLEILDDFMCIVKSVYDCMQEHHDEEFANENITRSIKIALATDDEEFKESRRLYIEEMSESLCEGCDAGCNIGNLANPLKGLFDFLDGITKKADEDDPDDDDDDEPEIECDVKFIKVKSPEELLEELNKISGKAQKKEGEE